MNALQHKEEMEEILGLIPFSRLKNLTANVELITSAEALRIRMKTTELANRKDDPIPQRPLNSKTVERYRRKIAAKEWGLSDSILILNEEGGSDNGNHRLEALSQERDGKAYFWVVRGLDREISRHIAFNADQGRPRSIQQKLLMYAELAQDLDQDEIRPRVEILRCFEDVFYPSAWGKPEKDFHDILPFIQSDLVSSAFDPLWRIRNDEKVVWGSQTKKQASARLKASIPLAAFMLYMKRKPNKIKELYRCVINGNLPFEGKTLGAGHPIQLLRGEIADTAPNSSTVRPFLLKKIILTIDRIITGYYEDHAQKLPNKTEVDVKGDALVKELFEHFRPAFPKFVLPTDKT